MVSRRKILGLIITSPLIKAHNMQIGLDLRGQHALHHVRKYESPKRKLSTITVKYHEGISVQLL